MKYFFIVNPIAGNDNQEKIFSRIKSTFRLIDDEMIIEETKHPSDAKEIAARVAKEYGSDCVVVSCGGDGTVHEIVNGLCGTDTPLMVLPFGTGNDFAKKLYGTKKLDVLSIIEAFGLYDEQPKYEVKPIDLIDYNGEKGINVMSFGLDTRVETIGKEIATKYPFLGHQAYNIAILPVLTQPIHYNISFELDCVNKETGEEYTLHEDDKDYALFAICNGSYYGGGYCPAPNSRLDDGLLDFAIVDGMAIPKALPIIPKYAAGTANEETCPGALHNGYIKSGRVWSIDGTFLPGNCDGEVFDYSELNFKVEEKALKLCVIKG